MNLARKSLSMLLLLPLVSVPALADFKYTDTSQITGGALMGMANFAAKFSKDSRAAMQPITTTHYIKGNRLRTDGSDGSIQIIDLDGQRIISIDNQKKTYSVATFEEIKAAMEKARRDAEAKMQQEKAGKPAAQAQDAVATLASSSGNPPTKPESKWIWRCKRRTTDKRRRHRRPVSPTA
jgi:hypothetical protein